MSTQVGPVNQNTSPLLSFIFNINNKKVLILRTNEEKIKLDKQKYDLSYLEEVKLETN